jgi:hypothetical protein
VTFQFASKLKLEHIEQKKKFAEGAPKSHTWQAARV